MLKQPVIKEVQLQYIINKSVFIAIILAAALGTSSAQGPPAFVTLPRHPALEERMADKEHPMPFRLELRNEMFEMVGRFAPGGGGGKGNKQSAGGSDFGQARSASPAASAAASARHAVAHRWQPSPLVSG